MKPGDTLNLSALDALRGVLAIYVLMGHARWLLWAGHREWVGQASAPLEMVLGYGSALLRFGNEAVMVFFALSGFFIHMRAAQKLGAGQVPTQRPGAFYRRRLHRLLPPYLVALLVTLLCDVLGRGFFPLLYQANSGDALLDQTFAKKGYGWGSVLPALFMLPSSGGLDFGSNGPLWSIAYEVMYYALYPAWLILRRQSIGLAYGGVMAACLLLPSLSGASFPVAVVALYPVWLAGAGLAELIYRTYGITLKRGSVAIVAGVALYFAPGLEGLRVIAALLYGTGMVAVFVGSPRGLTRSPVGRVAEYLGVRSYTIYVVHFPVLALFSAAVIQTMGGRPVHGWFALASALVAIGIGCLCFVVGERRFLHRPVRSIGSSGAGVQT